MKRKTSILLGGILLGISCLFGAGKQAYAEETLPGDGAGETAEDVVNMPAYVAYLTITKDTQVYIGPGKLCPPLGVLYAGQPAIATARTEDGWLQIYYIGMQAYIPEETVTGYVIPEPVPRRNVEIREDMKINALGDSLTYGDKLKDRSRTYAHVVSEK